MRSRKSNSRKSATGSIIPVRSPKTKKVTGFYKMVPITTKDGKRTHVARFLPRTKWPRSRSVLAKLGVRESLSQIEKNNKSNLRRGRAKRVARKSKSASRKSKRSSRKSERKARRSSRRSISPSERDFRRRHYNRETTKNIRPSVAYAYPSFIPTPSTPSSPIPLAPPNPMVGSSVTRGKGKRRGSSVRKSLSSGIEKMKQRHAQRRSSRSARRAARKQTRNIKAVGASVSRSSHTKRHSKRHSKRHMSSKHSMKGASVSRSSHSKKHAKKHTSSKHSMKGASVSRSSHSKRHSKKHAKKHMSSRHSMKGASVSRGSWSDKKNTQLKKLLRRDYGRVLTRDEFFALPKKVQDELQKQAYERAFKDVADRTPTRLLSEEGKAKRREKEEKERRRKSLSRSGKRLRQHQIPYQQAGNGYPGPEQAKRDFIDAYTRRYPERSTRLSAMRRDINRTDKELVDPYKPNGYQTWKNEPWKYDLRGIDTAESDDSFYDTYKETTKPVVPLLSGASVSKRRHRQRKHSKSSSHSKKSRRQRK